MPTQARPSVRRGHVRARGSWSVVVRYTGLAIGGVVAYHLLVHAHSTFESESGRRTGPCGAGHTAINHQRHGRTRRPTQDMIDPRTWGPRTRRAARRLVAGHEL